jgi:LysM domain
VTGTAVVLGLSALAGRAGAGDARAPARGFYEVQVGDTLWGIARGLVGSEGDPRPVVDSLVRLNHVQGGLIFPGERLLLP